MHDTHLHPVDRVTAVPSGTSGSPEPLGSPGRFGSAGPRRAFARERRHAARLHRRAGAALGVFTLLALALAGAVRADATPTVPADVPIERSRDDASWPGAGTLVLGPPGAGVEALRLDTRLALDVRGLLGELTLTQTFRNTTGDWLDGTYLFPLPPDAAVRGLELRVGERVVRGRVQRREAARETFERARASGRVAGLVEQQRPNLFTARLASVAPGGEIRVALDVLLPVEVRDDRLSLTLPTTLTPRYANAHASDAAAVSGPILPGERIRGPRFSFDARIEPLADMALVTSPSHRLATAGGRVVLEDAPMDGDLVLAWPFAHGAAPNGDAFVVRHGGERYVQLFMAPPARSEPDAAAPRELVLVVDTSGSMAGTSIVAARAALQGALDGLRPDDTFDLIAFDDDVRTPFDGARAATTRNVAAARRFVRGLRADGGTEMAPALTRALAPPTRSGDARGDDPVGSDDPSSRDASARLRQIVFLTDGSIADEARLLGLIRRDVGDARLFTVGIGAAPNGWFLDKAAEAGRGTALAIRDVDDVRDAVAALLGRLERPVLTDIEVQFPDGGGEPYPSRVPDLYAGGPLTVVARLDGAGREAVVTGWRGEERFVRRISLEGDGNDADRTTTPEDAVAPSIAMHWARAKVASLLDEQRESIDPERHRNTITALALDVGLVTPYTSFVAVEETPSRPDGAVRADADVANLVPRGNAMMDRVAMPRGAAGIDTLGLVATLATLLGSALLWLARRLGPAGRVDDAATS